MQCHIVTFNNLKFLIYAMNKKVRNQILVMYSEDQDMRLSGRHDNSLDIKNTNEMKKIVKKYGWLTYDLVGFTAAKGAWLLVQHADHDVEFQKKCLELMKEAVRKNQASKEDLAYLTDRVFVNTGKPQLYGTQFGKKNPIPIKDKKNLDKRRVEMGLGKFKEYKNFMKKLNKTRK